MSAIRATASPRPRLLGVLDDAGLRAGLAYSWSAFWRSRLLVWAVGCLAVLVLGTSANELHGFDPTGISVGFGRVGNVLAAPAVRWDAIWYLQIAHHGYRTAHDAGFYPFYPLLVRALSYLTASYVIAGVLISLVAMFIALELVRRLTELELGAPSARVVASLIAFGPMAFYLSAVYTESLFIALTAGTFYAARRGRWALAALLGAVAAMTRVGGDLMFPSVLLLFFYGPRTDRPPQLTGSRWRPRYRFAPQILWAGLIPAGQAVVAAYSMTRGLGPTATVAAQQHFWAHELTTPVNGAIQGVTAAWHQLSLELQGRAPLNTADTIFQLVVLVITVVATVGVCRRLPLAYGSYVVLALLLQLSTPTIGDPLRGLHRYSSMRFPLFMWLAAAAVQRGGQRRLRLAFGVALVLFTVQFATWQWVGSPAI